MKCISCWLLKSEPSPHWKTLYLCSRPVGIVAGWMQAAHHTRICWLPIYSCTPRASRQRCLWPDMQIMSAFVTDARRHHLHLNRLASCIRRHSRCIPLYILSPYAISWSIIVAASSPTSWCAHGHWPTGQYHHVGLTSESSRKTVFFI